MILDWSGVYYPQLKLAKAKRKLFQGTSVSWSPRKETMLGLREEGFQALRSWQHPAPAWWTSTPSFLNSASQVLDPTLITTAGAQRSPAEVSLLCTLPQRLEIHKVYYILISAALPFTRNPRNLQGFWPHPKGVSGHSLPLPAGTLVTLQGPAEICKILPNCSTPN